MRRVSVTELKNRLSEYLRLVKRGVRIQIVERGVPIAWIEGLQKDPGDADLDRLVREGLVTPPSRKPDPLGQALVPCKADPARDVVDQRGDR